ncbi:hypothetical protein B0H63DRAFT_447986 [Podospora didyma]|uniref:Uncharacterized protein n=1 Tax=Podospora didyma TaxID=330526 RepID=A0AAE0U128_9PEZI|nr:hypothetical protein B0H63DRAFT_447986 [Podospora didyma]
MSTTNVVDLLPAYRRLLRAGLRAVQYSKPARYLLVDKVRAGFRHRDGVFDAERVRRTTWFLNAAAQSRGIEHRIVKNLLFVAWMRQRRVRHHWTMVQQSAKRVKDRMVADEEKKARMADKPWMKLKEDMRPDIISGHEYEHFDRTVTMLNDTMGMCLR